MLPEWVDTLEMSEAWAEKPWKLEGELSALWAERWIEWKAAKVERSTSRKPPVGVPRQVGNKRITRLI